MLGIRPSPSECKGNHGLSETAESELKAADSSLPAHPDLRQIRERKGHKVACHWPFTCTRKALRWLSFLSRRKGIPTGIKKPSRPGAFVKEKAIFERGRGHLERGPLVAPLARSLDVMTRSGQGRPVGRRVMLTDTSSLFLANT